MSEIIFLRFRPGEQSLEWEFKNPENNHILKANSRPELIRSILTYRLNNRFEPIENLDMVLDEYLCRLPCNSGKCRVDQLLKRGLAAYWKGGIMLLQSLKYRLFAHPNEAERRANQCKDCVFNAVDQSEGFLKWSDQLAEASVGSRRVSCQNDLGNCLVCSCPLKAKVHWGDKVSLTEEELSKMKTVNCWQLGIQEKP